MGDMLSLIEKAESAYDEKQALELERKLKKNEFSLEDFRDQLRAMKKMGPIGDLLSMIPGMKKLAKGGDLDGAQSQLTKIEAIINSMTRQERQNHMILNSGRRKRIAKGSGTTVSDVNKFLKQFQQTRKMMKKLNSGAGRGLLAQLQGGR